MGAKLIHYWKGNFKSKLSKNYIRSYKNTTL